MLGNFYDHFKGAARAALFRSGGQGLLVWFWKLRGKDVSYLSLASRRERFKRIYDEGVWNKGSDEAPLSGPGSSLRATRDIRRVLPEILSELEVKTLLDVGCGDFTWMSQVEIKPKYIGVDLVTGIIDANNEKYSSDRRSFQVLDVCEEVPPPADAAICREVLFHLSFADAKAAIKNIRDAGVKFLIASSDPDVKINHDILTGDFREINLSIEPYLLGHPINAIAEVSGPNPQRTLAVWLLQP